MLAPHCRFYPRQYVKEKMSDLGKYKKLKISFPINDVMAHEEWKRILERFRA